MAGSAESRTTPPVVDQESGPKRELGERVYNTITDLVGKISALPEFQTAVATQFFGRTTAFGSPVRDVVSFTKEGFDYRIKYRARADTKRPHVQDWRHKAVNTELRVEKFDSKKAKEVDMHDDARVAFVDLQSDFVEEIGYDEDVAFNYGRASVIDEIGNYSGHDAIAVLPIVLKDLLEKPAIKL